MFSSTLRGLTSDVQILRYKLKHWMFSWKMDEENDLAFVVAQRLAFVKYKEHTCVKWIKPGQWKNAPKYVG